MKKKKKNKVVKLTDKQYGEYIMALKDERPPKIVSETQEWINLLTNQQKFSAVAENFCYLIVFFVNKLYNQIWKFYWENFYYDRNQRSKN